MSERVPVLVFQITTVCRKMPVYVFTVQGDERCLACINWIKLSPGSFSIQ